MKIIKIENPQMFLLLILFFALLIIPFIIFIKNKNAKNITSLVIHLLIATLLTSLFAKINVINVTDNNEIFVLADVSNSIIFSDKIDNYIQKIKEKTAKNDKLGVVCFASDSELLTPLNGALKSVSSCNIDKSSTNYYDAFNYTMSLFSNESNKKIILISDGLEIDGNVSNIITNLQNENIKVDVIYLDDVNTNNEVLIQDVTYTKSTFINVDENANVQIYSNYESTNLQIKIFKNDNIYKDEIIKINKGINHYIFALDTNSNTNNHYVIEINEDNDTLNENNCYYFTQEVVARSNLLLIANNYKEATYYNDVLKEFANVTTYQVSQYFPKTIEFLCTFDEIALANVNLNDIDDLTTFLDSLNVTITSYGKSLITFGGKNTYLEGNFKNTILEDMLPVELDASSTKDKAAIIFLIDNSGSMSGQSLESAKKGAIECLELLDENDLVGVITFSSSTQVICSPTYATIGGKLKIKNAINKINVASDTMMTPGLSKSYELLKDVSLANKEVILISDGMPGDTGQEEIATKMKDKSIVLSTINIGSGQNMSLMKSLANITGGKSYNINSSGDIASLIVKEVSDLVLDPILENDFTLKLNNEEDVLNGIESLPNILGCNYTSPKSNSHVAITTSTTLEKGTKVLDNIPLYAYWDYGNGKVSSFLSGISDTWLDNWQNNSNVTKFYQNIVLNNLPNTHSDSAYIINVTTNGHTSKISLEVPTISNITKYVVEITTPTDDKEKITLSYNSGKYEGIIKTLEKGNYKLTLGIINGTNYTSYKTSFDFSYSKEYLLKEPDAIILNSLVSENGVLINNLQEIDKIIDTKIENNIYKKQIMLPQIIISLVLFILDIIIRKFSLNDFKNIIKKFKKSL